MKKTKRRGKTPKEEKKKKIWKGKQSRKEGELRILRWTRIM